MKKPTEKQVEAAKAVLRAAGLQVDAIWGIEDIRIRASEDLGITLSEEELRELYEYLEALSLLGEPSWGEEDMVERAVEGCSDKVVKALTDAGFTLTLSEDERVMKAVNSGIEIAHVNYDKELGEGEYNNCLLLSSKIVVASVGAATSSTTNHTSTNEITLGEYLQHAEAINSILWQGWREDTPSPVQAYMIDVENHRRELEVGEIEIEPSPFAYTKHYEGTWETTNFCIKEESNNYDGWQVAVNWVDGEPGETAETITDIECRIMDAFNKMVEQQNLLNL